MPVLVNDKDSQKTIINISDTKKIKNQINSLNNFTLLFSKKNI